MKNIILNIKKKLDVKGFLIINYFITIVILYLIIQLADYSSYFAIKNLIFKDQISSYPNLSSMYNKDFSKINIGALKQVGGWVEVLDKNKKVIYVKGEKKDKIMQYNEKELYELISSSEPYSGQNPYTGLLTEVKGKNNEPYLFIMKIDRKKVSSSLLYKPSLAYKSDIPFVLKAYGVRYLFVFSYLLLGLYIYSRISSKFITDPLEEFIRNIRKIKKQDYSSKTSIKGLKELQDVENEFNEMRLKLEQVTKENKRIDESKKRLLVDISHDLKTPITSIQGFSKLLLEENVDAQKKEKFLNIIYDKSVYATLLINDLFEISKLEDAECHIAFEEHDFSEWLRRLIAGYYEEFNEKGFKLKIDISERPIIYKFDEKLMKRAISNIFINNIKYNKSGTEEQISCFSDSNSIFLKIGNNGQSIDEAIRSKIFEPFVRAGHEKSEGNGLGLAIAKKIIEKHGGSIALVSENNEGNIFNIILPLKF